jgi:polyisoprenoid-binding protein YceI
VKHLRITTVKGRFGKFAGTVRLDLRKAFQPDVEVVVDVGSLATGDAKRDAHLRSPDFFDVPNHPELVFRGGRVQGDINRAFQLHGELTIRGITHPVVLDVTNEGRAVDPWGNEKLAISATAKINRHDFGLRWNVALETGGFLVGDEVRITIEAQFARNKSDA